MIYLEVGDVLHVAERAIGFPPEVRDFGLLHSAVARPAATALGEDAYPTLHEKAAALVHSLARNHSLVDGNKRLALAALIVFLGINGRRLTMSNDEAYRFIVDLARGALDDVDEVAAVIACGTEPR